MNAKEEKAQLRKRMWQMLKAQSQKERQRKSEIIYSRVMLLEELKKGSAVMVYVADMYEVETQALIQSFLKGGKHVIIPFVDELKQIIPCQIYDLEADTEMTKYGFRQPKKPISQKPFVVDDVDILFVPGVAFDLHGYRLGRGWGCYDRLLAQIRDTIPTIGLAFDFQVYPHIPTDVHDKPLKQVISN